MSLTRTTLSLMKFLSSDMATAGYQDLDSEKPYRPNTYVVLVA